MNLENCRQTRRTSFISLRRLTVIPNLRHEKKLKILQTVYKSQQDELEKVRNQLNDFNSKREGLQNDIIVWREQSRSAIISMDRLVVEQDKINKNIDREVEEKERRRDRT